MFIQHVPLSSVLGTNFQASSDLGQLPVVGVRPAMNLSGIPLCFNLILYKGIPGFMRYLRLSGKAGHARPTKFN